MPSAYGWHLNPVLFIPFQTFAFCEVSFHLESEKHADQQVIRKQFLLSKKLFAYPSAWSAYPVQIKEKTACLVAETLHRI